MNDIHIHPSNEVFDLYFRLSAHPGVLLENGIIKEANYAFEGLTKKKKGHLINHSFKSFLNQTKGESMFDLMSELSKGEKHFTFIINNSEQTFNCKWTSSYSNNVSTILLILEPSVSLMITPLEKELFDDLQDQRELIDLMIESDEYERKKFSDYLHDEIGSLLATAKHQLNIAHNAVLADHLTSKSEIEKSIHLVDESIRQLRSIALQTAPISYEFGLINAINNLVDRLNKKSSNSQIQFISAVDKLKLNSSLEITTYRIIQELLNNTSKHSNASEIILQLIKHETSINITIEDNGKGFNPKIERKRKDTLGLKKIKQRVDLFRGKMQIDSSENSGTIITIELTID
jgi:signal transduction histidine kinase